MKMTFGQILAFLLDILDSQLSQSFVNKIYQNT